MASATLALPCAAYEFDPLACVNCGSNMRIIALIDDVDRVVEEVLKLLETNPPKMTPAPPFNDRTAKGPNKKK